MIAPGDSHATTDPDIAHELAAARVKELATQKRSRVLHGIRQQTTLTEFASLHLIAKKRAGQVRDDTVADHERYLARALDFFGADRDLNSITVADVRGFMEHLQTLPNRRGANLTAWSARHHLGALSNLYRRAISEGYVPPGYNPAAGLLDKPKMPREEARWFEVHEAALLLESARTLGAQRGTSAMPFAYELVATFLLTGGRSDEVLGIEVADVSFDRRTVTFRPNQWRPLKTAGSRRVVPLWPQLEETLRPYIFDSDTPPRTLLFPSLRTGHEGKLTDVRKMLDAIAVRVGWKPGEIRTKLFRHTYCSARLQTLDHGAPVSLYTVSRELGHASTAMVQRVYSHLGDIRHRSEAVEFRVEQHLDAKLGDGETVEGFLRSL